MATNKVKPTGTKGRRTFAGQKMQSTGVKRSGGGSYNWGNPMENMDEFYEGEGGFYDEEDGADGTLFDQMRQANIVQQRAAAARLRRAEKASPQVAVAPLPSSKASTAWGQSSRVEAMKDRLLSLEREKIARMAPERLELMNLLADRGVNLDEDTVSALLAWKKQS